MLNKEQLINDLKSLHNEIVLVYEQIFEYKYSNEIEFRTLLDEEYVSNNITKDVEKKVWNKQYFHRSAYTLLNKILFIRICEDKGFMLNEEDKVMGEKVNPNIGQKLSMLGLQKWSDLISNYSLSELVKFAFKDMNRSYNNIQLYKEDKYDWLIPKSQEVNNFFLNPNKYEQSPYDIFENVLEKIIITLDTSKYDFGKSSDNVLGDVYEKFMDRETRKGLGQFYTPDYVIEYILSNTVYKANVLDNPFVSVLDPSCGSGHFLIMAYDILREKFEENLEALQEKYKNTKYYVKHGEDTKVVLGFDYWTEKYLHYHLLKHCIFGSDIDAFALQLTTINLLLKDLDNFITDDLNIIECDSLFMWEEDIDWRALKQQISDSGSIFIENNYTNIKGERVKEIVGWEQAEKLIQICEFWDRDYDYVVGNPPYGSKITNDQKKYYMKKYSDVHMRTPDVYNYFISRATKKSNTSLSFIVPDSLLAQYEYTKCRTYLLDNFNLKTMVSLGENVFDDNSYPTVIFHVDNTGDKTSTQMIDISQLDGNSHKEDALRNQNYNNLIVEQKNFKKIDGNKLLFLNNDLIDLILHVKSGKKTLGEITDYLSVGVATGNDKAFVVDNKTIQKNNIDNELLRPVIVGGNVQPFYHNTSGKYIIYINRSTDMDGKENTIEYLENFKGQLSSRREARNNTIRWFELHWPRTIEQFERKKVILRQTGDRLIASIDSDGLYNLNSVIDIILSESIEEKYSEELITAILNSKLMNVYYNLIVQEDSRGYAEVKPVVIKSLPIPEISQDRHINIKKKVNSIQENYREIDNLKISLNKGNIMKDYLKIQDKKDQYEMEIATLKNELEIEICDIYNLSSKQIETIKAYWNNKETELPVIDLTMQKFIEEHHLRKKSLNKIAKEYAISPEQLLHLKQNFKQQIENELLYKLYDLTELNRFLGEQIFQRSYGYAVDKSIYFSPKQIFDLLKKEINDLDEMLDILKSGETTKRTSDVIKDILNLYADTWNKFVKDRKLNKSLKPLVKYETNIYGLSDWSDEIHKKYFIDAIDYYTGLYDEKYKNTVFEGVKKTKKKADSALKAIRELEIEDKEDYIEILTEKVKKAFD